MYYNVNLILKFLLNTIFRWKVNEFLFFYQLVLLHSLRKLLCINRLKRNKIISVYEKSQCPEDCTKHSNMYSQNVGLYLCFQNVALEYMSKVPMITPLISGQCRCKTEPATFYDLK